MSRIMKIVFTVSLALNLLFAGTAVGVAGKMAAERMPPPGMLHYGPPGSEAQEAAAKAFREAHKEMRGDMQAMRQARAEMETIITAKMFDSQAYAAASERMLDLRDRMTRRKAETMGQVLGSLPPEQRQQMARHLVDRMSGKPPGRPPGAHMRKLPEEN